MCSPSPPPPPDYTGAAQAQGAANVETARQQGIINNPNVTTPWDTKVVNFGPNGQPIINYNLSPEEYLLYQQGLSNRGQAGNLAGQGLSSLQGIIGTNVNFAGMPGELGSYNPGALSGANLASSTLNPNALPSMGQVYQTPTNLPAMPASSEAIRNQVIDAMMSRSNQDIATQADQQNSDLAAAGIRPGTVAYDVAQRNIARQKNDALTQAQLAGSTAASQAYQQDLSTRQQAQNEALANNQAAFSESQAQRQQAAQEQAQGFSQTGQAAQLFGQQQAQGSSQANMLRQQAIAELLAQRETPLNEISALLGGSQVGNPFTQGQGTNAGGYSGANVAPPPIFGAMQQGSQYQTDVYNQQVGTANSQMSAAAGIASAIAIAF